MKTPVVIIIHRRPDLTRRLVNSLRQVKPQKLYVFADGPRNPTEVRACEITRDVINEIDWKCEIIKEYSKANIGLRRRVVSGLNYVFKREEYAIILEDDLVPDPTFFRFCSELLHRYRNTNNIISIAGNNFQFGKTKIPESYYFSRYVHSWGWATWRRAWKLYDDSLSGWQSRNDFTWLKATLGDFTMALYWQLIFTMTKSGIFDSWAYRWTYTSLKNNMVTIIPSENLVSNYGYGVEATHTKSKMKTIGMEIKSIGFPLIHPRSIRVNKKADSITENTIYLTPRIALGLLVRYTLSKVGIHI